MTISSNALALDKEYVPADEESMIESVIRDTISILKMHAGPVLRGQHAKSTGNVRAKFIIDPERPPETRFGIFRETRTFDALVRFSNGKGSVAPDFEKDARGMAIKVAGVDGPRVFDEVGEEKTQDFVMINFPVFAFTNAAQYAKFTSLRRRLIGILGESGNKLAQLLFLGLRWRQLRIGLKLKRKSASPLVERYWSMSPYRLGDRAIKFSAIPRLPITASWIVRIAFCSIDWMSICATTKRVLTS
jgi:hypothetical protein